MAGTDRAGHHRRRRGRRTAAGETLKPRWRERRRYRRGPGGAADCRRVRCARSRSSSAKGSTHKHRSRILGDTEESDPDHWEIGGPPRRRFMRCLVHAISARARHAPARRSARCSPDYGGGVANSPARMQRGYRRTGTRAVRISRRHRAAAIAGHQRRGRSDRRVHSRVPEPLRDHPPTPVVPAESTPARCCRRSTIHISHGRLRDLGLNGSYVVYRKLQQDVAGFWQFMKREAVRASGKQDAPALVWLASRCVGRWPSGAPLVLAPLADDPQLRDRNDFLYRDDPDGLACPIGAHIRRTNPRDDIKPYPAAESLSMSEAHRLLRRARVFGPPLFDPTDLRRSATIRRRSTTAASRSQTMAARAAFISSASTRASRASSSSCSRPGATTRTSVGSNDNKDPISGDNAPDQTAVEPHDDSRQPAATAHEPVAAVRDGQGRRLSVHAEPDGAAIPCQLERLNRVTRSTLIVEQLARLLLLTRRVR